jgi:hypothetical protein
MNTGYVQSNGTKYSDNMQVSTSTTYGRGWAKFPLSSIPAGATISAVTIQFYTYGGSTSSGANTIRGFTGDPVSMTGATLYNTIGAGTSYNSSTWTIGSTVSPSLNSRVLAGAETFLQGQIGTGFVNFGFVRGSSNLHSIYGFSNTTYRVRLLVTYTNPTCAGTPAAGIANVSGNTSIQVCDNSSFSLNCVGAASGTGITTNWQIATSAGGPFSDISGASASTFSTSTAATSYYRYRVTCSSSGLSSYSNVLTVTYSTISNPTASNQTISCGQTAALTASGAPVGGDYMWYSDATGTTQVGTGATFTTAALTTTTTYYVRSKLGLCNSALVPLTITVTTTVASPSASGQTISCNQTATLTASGAPSGGSYTWYSNSTGTTQVGAGSTFTTPALSTNTTYYVAANSTSSTFNFTSPTVNSTSNPGTTTTYTVPSTPQPSGNATITVSAMGDFDFPGSGEFLDVYGENSTYLGQISGPTNCSWYTGTYTVPLATLTNWVSNGSITLTFTPGTGVNTNQCNANAYEVYFTISYTQGNGCLSALVPVTVTVNPASTPIVSNTTINCNQTATLTASSNSTLTWYSDATGTTQVGSGTSFTTPVLSATTTYYVKAGSGACASALVPVTVTVNTASTPMVSNTTINCGQTATLTASSNSTLIWYSNSTGTTQVGTGTSFTTPILTTTTTYYVQAGSGACASALVPVTITVNTTLASPTASGQTISCNQTAILTASGAPTGGSYTWYSNSTGTTQVGAGSSFTTPALTSSTTYYVAANSTSSTFNFTSPTVNSTSNPGTTTTYTVPSTPQPSGNATITVSAMGDFDFPGSGEFLDVYGENSTYLGQISGPTNCSWYTGTYTVPLATLTNWVSNGSITLTFTPGTGVNTNQCNANAYEVYFTISYTQGNGCLSALVPVTVTVNPASTPIVSNTTINCNQTATLTASSNSTLTWYSDATGTTQVGSGTSFTTPVLSATTTYYVKAGSGACASALVPVTVTVNTASSPIVSNTTINCNQTTTLTASSNSTLTWYSNSTGTTQVGTGTSFTTPALTATTIYYVQAGSGGCASSLVPATATVNLPAGPTVTGTTLICGSGSTTLTASGSGNPIQWYSDAAATNLLGTGTTYTTPNLSASTTYYARESASAVQSFTYTSPVTATYTTGGAVSITVPSTPTGASGNGTLTVYLIGDLDGSTENVTISSESGILASGVFTGVQCSGTYWSNSYPLTATNINSWAANGTINFNFQSSTSVNNICTAGAAFQVYVVLTYNYVISSCNSSLTPVTVTINQPSINPSSITGSSSICLGANTTLTSVGGSLGAGANYQWGSGSVVGTNPISGATTSTLSVSPVATTNYWVQIVNGTGPCSATTAGLSTLVTVNTPTFTATPTAGSVVWRGASSPDWTTASNWYAYNGTSYAVATATPTSSSNVIIPANQGCVPQQPTVISGTVSAKDVVIETGADLTMTTGTLNVDGNFTINGTGTFAAGSGTVNFTSNGTQVVTVGNQAFNSVTISGFGTVQLTGNTTINGDFLNTDGSLDMSNFNLTVVGNYANYNSISGLIPGTGTVIFNKASGIQTVDQLALDFHHIQHSGAGTVQFLSDISTTGDIINSAGTMDGNDKIITVRNNFTNTATFTSGIQGLGEIYFENVGGSQTLTPGTSTFHKFAHTGTGTLNLTGTVDVKGDVVIDAPISAGTSTLTLSGMVNQTISGTESVIPLNSMTVSKTGGTLTLLQPVNVTGNLTMANGNIVNPSSVITLGSSSADPGTLSYTSGTITGALRRYFDASATPGSGYYFPVGNSSNTRGSTIDFTSSPGTNQYLTVRYQPGTAMGATPLYDGLPLMTNDAVVIQNYEDEGFWEINPTADNYSASINSAPYSMTLQMKNLTTVNDRSTVRIIKAAGSNNASDNHVTWTSLNFGANPVVGASNTDFTVTGTSTGFSWFGAGSGNNNPLPVELVSFSGVCDNGLINLTWQTASEFNSSHFDVEKSRDGENWQVLTTVQSAGTSNELITYQTADHSAIDGNNYYRLLQVDIDGTEKVYDPINVSCTEVTPGYFSTFPNPSGTSFQVIVNNKELIGVCTLNMVDATGKVIEQREIEVKDGINMFVINQEMAPGIYFLNISNEFKTSTIVRQAIK